MNAFQSCSYTADAVPLYLQQKLYLKPISKLELIVDIPKRKVMGECISNWDIMEAFRKIIAPEEFMSLKSTKTSMEQICFEAEMSERGKLKKAINLLNGRTLKLQQYKCNLMKVKASEVKSDFPSKHAWDSFFRDASDMNESKPGERPDTIHISHLPKKWFLPLHLENEEDAKPSEKLIYRIFDKFGKIRHVDVPCSDPFRNKMKNHVSGVKNHDLNDSEEYFEAYIQFKDYNGFVKAMDALKNMKLLLKKDKEAFLCDIKVDFDRTKHLSEANIRRRGILRDRLMEKKRKKEQEELKIVEEANKKKIEAREKEIELKEEKERRRREREEKRKQRFLDKLKENGTSDELNNKIAREEKKLLKAQRKLEAIRLVEELFKRIKIKNNTTSTSTLTSIKSQKQYTNDDELSRLKKDSEGQVRLQREKLHHAIEGRVILKSILSDTIKSKSKHSESSDNDEEEEEEKERQGENNENNYNGKSTFTTNEFAMQNNEMGGQVNPWYTNTNPPEFQFQYHPHAHGHAQKLLYPPPPALPPNYYQVPNYGGRTRGGYLSRNSNNKGYGFHYNQRGGGVGRNMRFRGRGRGSSSSYSYSAYPPELQEVYTRYFERFLHERSYSRSKSRTRTRSRSRSRSHSRRSRTRSSSRRRSSRKRRRSYSRSSRSRSYSRHRSRKSSSSSPSSYRGKSRSKSMSKSKSRSKSSKRSYTPKRKSRTRE